MTKRKATTKPAAKKPTSKPAAAAPEKTTKPAAKKPAKGRPKGAKTRKVIVSVTPGRCRNCGSTERTPYHDVRAMEYAGREPDGQPYTHIVWRRTRCRSCADGRIDRFTENRV